MRLGLKVEGRVDPNMVRNDREHKPDDSVKNVELMDKNDA